MSWEEQISGCFGSKDKIFAGHPYDIQRAAKLLTQAIEENIGWSEYTSKIKEWLKSEGCSKEHIVNQMEKVKNTKSYFNCD